MVNVHQHSRRQPALQLKHVPVVTHFMLADHQEPQQNISAALQDIYAKNVLLYFSDPQGDFPQARNNRAMINCQ